MKKKISITVIYELEDRFSCPFRKESPIEVGGSDDNYCDHPTPCDYCPSEKPIEERPRRWVLNGNMAVGFPDDCPLKNNGVIKVIKK